MTESGGDPKFLTTSGFSSRVFENVGKYDGSYMQAIVHLAEEMKIDIESIGDVLSPALKANVASEAEDRNLIKKTNKLM